MICKPSSPQVSSVQCCVWVSETCPPAWQYVTLSNYAWLVWLVVANTVQRAVLHCEIYRKITKYGSGFWWAPILLSSPPVHLVQPTLVKEIQIMPKLQGFGLQISSWSFPWIYCFMFHSKYPQSNYGRLLISKKKRDIIIWNIRKILNWKSFLLHYITLAISLKRFFLNTL